MSVAEELERLQTLRAQGALNDAEFAQAKARVLGQAAHENGASTWLHRLARSSTDHVFGGVCGGLGKRTGLPSWVWRVMFILAALTLGIGVIGYLVLWIFMPLDTAIPPGGSTAS
ncbi:MAG TPA: PspC domain-containing protein [Steroidobacteraceae bacterium]